MFSPKTSVGSLSATSSPASESGVTRCDKLDGPMTDLFGREAALAPRSPSLERKRSARNAKAETLFRALDELAISYAADAAMLGLPMPATYGQRCGDLSHEDAQYASLVSRLQAVTERFGSRLYEHRWKSLDTVFGLRASMLHSSAPRTGGRDYTSWPTPQSHDERERGNTEADDHHFPHDLSNAATMASWPTPRLGGQGDRLRSKNRSGRRHAGEDLSTVALLAAWQTPKSPTGGGQSDRKTEGGGLRKLEDQALLTVFGETPNGSGAGMASTGRSKGQLNPSLSRFLMGLPLSWDLCAMKVEPKSSRRSSRKPATVSEDLGVTEMQ
jgi:hypothetical protein